MVMFTPDVYCPCSATGECLSDCPSPAERACVNGEDDDPEPTHNTAQTPTSEGPTMRIHTTDCDDLELGRTIRALWSVQRSGTPANVADLHSLIGEQRKGCTCLADQLRRVQADLRVARKQLRAVAAGRGPCDRVDRVIDRIDVLTAERAALRALLPSKEA